MINHILLATDGSGPAERAADFAASLALRYRARITILHAFMPVAERVINVHNGYAQPGTLHEAQACLASISRRLLRMGVGQVETEVVEGPATNVIIGTAETHQPDLIVLSARGLGTWPGRVLGSVSMAVTQRVQCPVLVVK